jgi:hypothetical protein
MPECRAARLWVIVCLLFSLSPFLVAQGAPSSPASSSEEDADRDHPAEREIWFMQGRVAPKGKTAAEMRWQAYQQKIQLRAARMMAARQAAALGTPNANAPAGTPWIPLGPAPLVSDPGTGQDYGFVSGRATSVVIDPADATGNTVYLGGAYGGLWRSQNAGSLSPSPSTVTWTPMIDNQPTLAVGAIALQPCSVALSNCDSVNHLSKTILIGTGEPNSAIDSYYGLGILRSTDGGNTWLLITGGNGGARPFKGLGFSQIAFNTTSGSENIVVAAAASTIGSSDGARVSGQLSGPFVSTDSGATWNASASISDGTFGGAVGPISVTSVVYNAAAGKFFMAMRFHGFYSSTDGSNWTRLAAEPAPTNTGINNSTTCPTSGNTGCPFYRGQIAVVPLRNEMYVWYTDGNDVDQGIWRSTTGGSSWTQLNDANIASCGDPGGCGTVQGFYDLELAAVPNGSSTDLYVGTRNLFKCTISGTVTASTCSGTGTTSFQNLTHVYNCGGHATVHPDQHGLDSMIASGKDVLYFANDGGVNRALDGFTGLISNSCFTNLFDDLNGSLGSMTQFVSFSQDPTNSAILLGGTQDNGSPSTSQTNTNWHSVLGGDGGYNEIDPVNPNNWFTSNTGLSIQSCSLGASCLENSFSNPPIVTSATLGSDSSAFYTPYILDPQNNNALLVGTCRIWRGSTTGASFVAISPNFDAGVATTCPNPSNFVHAVAAGGAKGTNGFSKVVYAGLSGTGSLVGTPQGGRVFVTKDSSASPITWTEITPSANLSTFYTIGDITIDKSDATGQTAYVGLQGFSTSHVLQTANAGTTWTDFSGALPNAPVNSLVVDPVAHIVYAGTDVGVFSSPTSSATWTEVGPAPGPGISGYIPDTPVTRLRLFSNSGNVKLRASTYGRGIWEFVLATGTPDFTANVPTATLTTYPSLAAVFSGTLTATNGYASPVNLSCTGTKPSTCAAVTTPVTPTSGGVAFSINTSNAATGDFAFTIHAAGTDSVPQLHDTAATLHVVNFAIGAPSPTTVTANVPNASNATTFQVTAAGSFADTVNLTCSGLPTGASCNFSPSANVQPTTATPVTVTLTIGTTISTPVGSSTVTIKAHDATNPEPAAKTQNLTLNVTAIPDYTLGISNSPQTTTVLGSATFNGTLTAINSYNKAVNLSCIAGTTNPPATCTVSTSPITPTAGGVAFTISASDTTVNTFNFKIHSTDGTITHDSPVTLTVNADFHVPATTTICTAVTAGGTSTCSIPIGPDGQLVFANTVTYTCAPVGFPNLSACTFNPGSLVAGMPATTVSLSIRTTAAVASLRPSGPFKPSGPLFAFWLSLPALGIVSLSAQRRSRKRLAMLCGVLLVMALIGVFASCGGGGGGGGGGQPGTTKGTYTFNVNATSNGITHSAPMSLTVN